MSTLAAKMDSIALWEYHGWRFELIILPLQKLNVKFEVKSQTAQNFRQLADVKNVDVCPILKNIGNFPMFTEILNWFNATFGGQLQTCPFENFLVTNASWAPAGKTNLPIPDGLARCKSLIWFFKLSLENVCLWN